MKSSNLQRILQLRCGSLYGGFLLLNTSNFINIHYKYSCNKKYRFLTLLSIRVFDHLPVCFTSNGHFKSNVNFLCFITIHDIVPSWSVRSIIHFLRPTFLTYIQGKYILFRLVWVNMSFFKYSLQRTPTTSLLSN